MLFDLSTSVRVSNRFPNEVVLRIITRNLLEENPVKVYGEEGTLDGEFSDVPHPHRSAPATAQVCLYRLPQERKMYSFVGWNPVLGLDGYGVVVERGSDGRWQVSILDERAMDINENFDSVEELHDAIFDDFSNYDEDNLADRYSSIVVDFP